MTKPTSGAARIAVGLTLVALVAAACSSSSTPPASSSKTTGTGTASQDFLARALNLQNGDLPDESWTKEPQGTGPNVVRESLNTCVLAVPSSITPAATAVSTNFLQTATGQEVGSQVQVFNSDAEAATNSKNAASGSVSNCMSGKIKTGLQGTVGKGVTVQSVATTSVPPAGTPTGGFAQQTAAGVTYPDKNKKQQSTTVYVEVVGFPSKSALIEAEFENTGAPPPADVVASTMQLLAKRAAAS